MQTKETMHHEQQIHYHTISRDSTTQKAVTIRETTAVKQSYKVKVKKNFRYTENNRKKQLAVILANNKVMKNKDDKPTKTD
jgi:hypothetical protein